MEHFIAVLTSANAFLNGLVWGPYMLALLVGTGIWYTFRTKFLQIRKFGFIVRETLFKSLKKKKSEEADGDISPFQALTTALAATVGTGNIAGVATAIALGGPGAIFWMWISAFFGMLTKYAEVVLAIQYREKNSEGNWVGGPMYYLAKGLKLKWLAYLFSLFGALAAFGIGNMVQANSVADALQANFQIPPAFTGFVLALGAGLVILGGIRRIARVTEKIVPFMALCYIAASVVVLISNLTALPAAFALIFKHAFTPSAAAGGFAGATVIMALRFGIARGVFSNEAGLGSASIAHAAARTDHPARQGMWGIMEVFIDTLLICSLTALVILTSGVWSIGATGAALTSSAFNATFPSWGGAFVAVSILFFAFSTTLGWAYYGEKCAEHLCGPRIKQGYRLLWIPMIFMGAIMNLELIWAIADTLNGLMALPNLMGLLGLSGVVLTLTKDFFSSDKKKT